MLREQPREFIIGFIIVAVSFLAIASGAVYLFFYVQAKSTAKTPGFSGNANVTPVKKRGEKAKYAILKDGQSLWDLAEQEYGSGFFFPTILELNNFPDPDRIEPGTKVRVR